MRVRSVRPVRAVSSRARRRAGHQTAVVAPVEADPRCVLLGLVLQVSGLVEKLVVVDAEHRDCSRRGADSADLRPEKARGHAGHNHEGRKTVEVRQAGADRIAGNLGTLPFDGIRDRRIAQHAEVECLVRILPDVFGIDHQVPSKSLLETRVELIAVTGAQRRCGYTGDRRPQAPAAH